jgi:hypothetical protein
MFVYISSSLHQQVTDTVVKTKLCIHAEFSISYCKDNIKRDTVNREIFVMVLFFSVWLVCVYTCITVIDKVLLRKEVRQKGTD